ncbi:YIP1 family protein [Eisenbergiella sp.]
MRNFLEALNRPADAYRQQRKIVAWLLVAITIFIVTIFDPLLRSFVKSEYHTNVFYILCTTLFGIASYLLISFVLWLICKCFGSKTTLSTYIKTWGISFFPNIICSFVVVITEVYFYVFWNSTLWGMILSIVFIGILIWKITLYVIFLREVAGLQRGKLIGAFIVVAVIIAALSALNGYVGLKTPIL